VNYRNYVPLLALLCALGTGAAACSSGSPSSSAPPAGSGTSPATSAPASPSATATGASSGSAVSQITANWTAFFSPKTPVSKRVSLLQNGSAFASTIQAQAGSALASTASAKVTKVTVTSASQAKVTYDVLLAGTPALKNQSGVAVLQNGTWKVGDASFCGLLTLENSGKPPAVCKSVS